MFSINAIHIQLLKESCVTVTEYYISISVFVNVLAIVSDFFILLFPLSWNYMYAGIPVKVLCIRHMGALFLYLDSTKCAI